MRLIALYPILYLSKQYSVGDELPANDSKMLEAWLEAGTAKWQNEKTEDDTFASATSTVAEAGFEGDSAQVEGELVGKVPKRKNEK